MLPAGLIFFSTSAVLKAVGAIHLLVSRVSGDDIIALDIICVGSQVPYGAKYLAIYYAVEGKIERSWSFLTDNINSIREAPSQTKHTIKMFVHSRKSQPDTLYGHVTIQGRLEGVMITRHSPLNARDLHFL